MNATNKNASEGVGKGEQVLIESENIPKMCVGSKTGAYLSMCPFASVGFSLPPIAQTTKRRASPRTRVMMLTILQKSLSC